MWETPCLGSNCYTIMTEKTRYAPAGSRSLMLEDGREIRLFHDPSRAAGVFATAAKPAGFA